MNKTEIYDKAIEKYGIDGQLNMLMEECAELIVAVNKYKRKPGDDQLLSVIEEMADVEIMIDQLSWFFHGSKDIVDAHKISKLKRLIRRLGDGV